ncbi:hypothetical protein [Flavobacterium aquicola]|uniref:Uncharacterized protein n=1 Tax=Flavobacterium aquicola TaxID=1682742 RepID=A0A3E0ERM8_9FLAO|nr:hypothetical protein [Flavobacterium aquicola]REH00842.1 hypothetical protein C8P67_10290 [Flavobacterium aquicola]
MKKTNETDALNESIVLLQQQYNTDLFLLKEQFHIAYESVKPINLIQNLVHEVTSSPKIKEDVLGNVMGLITGFISKKLMVNHKSSSIKKLFGTILQFGIANIVSKHSNDITATGSAIFNNFIKKTSAN